MARNTRETQADLSWIRLYALPTLLIVILLALAIRMLDLAPRRTLVFAAGSEGGSYHQLAQRYRAILARDDIAVTILTTAGSVENAELIAGGAADVAFLQGGVEPRPDAGIEALAATFLEPFWVFHTGVLADPANPAAWAGLRIAAGRQGSGARFAADAVIRALDLPDVAAGLVDLGGAEAAEALLAGEVDVALFVAPASAPYMQPLFAAPEARLASIRDTEALVRRLSFVQPATIPPSAFDYAGRRPPSAIDLVAMTGRLVAREGLHPSLVDRLVNAARHIHSDRDLVTEENQFPGTLGADLPLNPQAVTLLGAPPSPLYRFMPYWVVAQVNSFALLLVPILVLLIPIFRIAPGIYQWRMRARVYRHYTDLLEIDREVMAGPVATALDRLESRLNAIEADLVSLNLPLRFREYAYTLRVHIDLVRKRIAEVRSKATR
jgi:TRAP-type uncharacterized transport system substrate-binding protein